MERLLDAMTILSIVLMLVILYSVRRSHIRVEYSVSWLAAAIILLPPRAALFAACDARFLAMMQAGALAEVDALLKRGLAPALPAMRRRRATSGGPHR